MSQEDVKQRIKILYDALLPPVSYRTAICPYNDEEQMLQDLKNYQKSDFPIEDIQYELKLDRIVEQDGQKWHVFSIKSEVPISQKKDFTFLLLQTHGCKIGKIKASTTRLEVLFGLDANEPDKKGKPQTMTLHGFLGQTLGKFKLRYSNYVKIELQSQV